MMERAGRNRRILNHEIRSQKFGTPPEIFGMCAPDQSSYFIRACKTWNVLSSDLRNQNIGGLSSFKASLKSYYKHALSSIFDLDDPRTWKSVCIKCKRGRSLSQPGYQLLLAVLLLCLIFISCCLVMSVCFLEIL